MASEGKGSEEKEKIQLVDSIIDAIRERILEDNRHDQIAGRDYLPWDEEENGVEYVDNEITGLSYILHRIDPYFGVFFVTGHSSIDEAKSTLSKASLRYLKVLDNYVKRSQDDDIFLGQFGYIGRDPITLEEIHKIYEIMGIDKPTFAYKILNYSSQYRESYHLPSKQEFLEELFENKNNPRFQRDIYERVKSLSDKKRWDELNIIFPYLIYSGLLSKKWLKELLRDNSSRDYVLKMYDRHRENVGNYKMFRGTTQANRTGTMEEFLPIKDVAKIPFDYLKEDFDSVFLFGKSKGSPKHGSLKNKKSDRKFGKLRKSR